MILYQPSPSPDMGFVALGLAPSALPQEGSASGLCRKIQRWQVHVAVPGPGPGWEPRLLYRSIK
jgi:hypothetical protein